MQTHDHCQNKTSNATTIQDSFVDNESKMNDTYGEATH